MWVTQLVGQTGSLSLSPDGAHRHGRVHPQPLPHHLTPMGRQQVHNQVSLPSCIGCCSSLLLLPQPQRTSAPTTILHLLLLLFLPLNCLT